MGESINLSPLGRLGELLRPDWSRTVAARRVAAAALVLLAAAAALRPDPDDDRVDVVVAARDLTPGAVLTADDVRLATLAAAEVPDGATAEVDAVVGTTLAGPVRRGETLTDVRLLSPRLADAAAGPNARIVPLSLAQSAVLDLIRPGDVVDVLAGPDDETGARVVATGAVVVLVSPAPTGIAAGADRVVLVALPAPAATDVAAAALVRAVALTLH
ncbi:SAF domain-containing protein [Mycolicibacterium phlei]